MPLRRLLRCGFVEPGEHAFIVALRTRHSGDLLGRGVNFGGNADWACVVTNTPNRQSKGMPDALLEVSPVGVVVEVESKCEILTAKLRRQWREGIRRRNATPGRPVKGDVAPTRHALQTGNSSVLENGEFDRYLALFHDRRARYFGNEVVPVRAHIVQHTLQIWPEINSHGVAKNVQVSQGCRGLPALSQSKITARSTSTTTCSGSARSLLELRIRRHRSAEDVGRHL